MAEKEQEPRPPAEASKMPAAPGSADAGLDSVLADAADPDVPAVELCAVSIDVPDSVETVVVNTSNGTPGVSLSDTTLPDAVVSAVLKSESAAGTLDDASGLPDAAAAAALSSVVDSEPAAVETVVSTEALPDVTVPSTSGLSSVSTSSSVSDRCDARIVRFNNRDLESLRKLQNELNTRKSGGVPRSPGSPIVIRAELTSPQKGGSAQAPQVLVVQKPSPGCSPKKADIRVIHPPGVTVRRRSSILLIQLQMSVPAASGGGTTSGGLTKVILQPAGQLMSGATFQFVGAMAGAGGQAAQPTLVLSSPTRATPIRTTTGQQLVRVAAPGTTSVSAPKGMYVVSPMKLGGKVAMIPINVGKSPQRIAPAPTTSSVVTGLSVPTSRVALAASSTSTATTPTVRPTAPTTTIVPVPGKVNVLLKPSIGQAVAVSRAGTVTAVVQTSSASGAVATSGTSSLVTSVSSSSAAVQVPGSKFHYVRLVSAPAASTQASAVLGAAKPPTLVPVTSARPLVPAVPATVASSTSSATLPAGVRLTVPIAPAISAQQGSSTGVTVSNSQRVLIPASATSVRPSLPTGPLSSLPTAALISAGGTSMQNAFVVVPAQYVAQFQQGTQPSASPSAGTSRVVFQTGTGLLGSSGGFVPIAAATTPTTTSVSAGPDHREPPAATVPPAKAQVNGTSCEDNSRPRKPCNCTKSQCLKLYCDCFANGEFCHSCNCNNCFNNLEHEEERQKAIGACLERNPNAFRPKIGKGKEGDHERRHTKGCNCKRSGCLKNYCECYEAKILCSSMCKCVGCKNFEDSSERKTLMQLADAAEVRVQQQAAARTKMSACDLPMRPAPISVTGERLPFAFITQEVVEATCQCLLARADEAERLKRPFAEMERSVLEEFGRCLEAIIDSAHRTKGKPTGDTAEKKTTPASLPPERAASRRTKTARRMLNL
ncbi:protein lin-54 homolog isoform X4 [Dermacentor albipictus]|uniref:protein lin-54 homolog isoform X4 n=1 Tax=Dermacentor albipictus TaxID=60249 RepID=UPI0031FBD070